MLGDLKLYSRARNLWNCVKKKKTNLRERYSLLLERSLLGGEVDPLILRETGKSKRGHHSSPHPPIYPLTPRRHHHHSTVSNSFTASPRGQAHHVMRCANVPESGPPGLPPQWRPTLARTKTTPGLSHTALAAASDKWHMRLHGGPYSFI